MKVAALFALAFAIGGLGLYVVLAAPRRSVNRWFAAFTLSLVGWIIGIAALNFGWWPRMWGRLAFASSILLPATFLGFTTTYPRRHPWPSPHVLRAGLALGTVFAALSLSTPLVVEDVTVSSDGVQRTTGTLYPVFVAYFLSG